jgi:YfiH family protein
VEVDRLATRPLRRGGYVTWADRHDGVEARFLGRGPDGERQAALAAVEDAAPPVAWARQVHSATLLPAAAGFCGEGDALHGEEPGLALSVITADCVPVLLASARRLLAVHAGWRGLAAGILPAALSAAGDGPLAAWIGPTIGSCCYEVGPEVAREVAAASGPEVVLARPGGRPHLDLVAAALLQLERGGVAAARVLPLCTACHPDLLWSYRRDGARAGRNMAFLWRPAG